MALASKHIFAPGSRVEIRDTEWRIKRIDNTTDGGHSLTCEGISELVRGREATFLTALEDNIRVLAPEDTQLLDDTSSGYQATKLYLDTLIRQASPTDNKTYLGHKAAMDVIPFQLQPTHQALSQPRQRILIADAVGLGKTLEAGILTSELIARGKGKRILVLAVKSMLTQFQQEFWNRFSIGLTRLDSQGLQRIRNRIPSNHNPFHYFDRAIISIDTLKQDIDYRHYLEQAYWDIIIIDEAHNVAKRSNHSQRARLAELLAERSDTLIMLSATPHDGKPESFASLMNMLDPTAIANPEDYQEQDFRDKGLVIRRFKHDIKDQLSTSFPDRDIANLKSKASLVEETAYQTIVESNFKTLQGGGTGQLFRTTLTKAMFSSPAALLSTVENRLNTLQKRLEDAKTKHDTERQQDIEHDIDQLEEIRLAAQAITPNQFSKYQHLVSLLSTGTPEGDKFNWQPKLKDDRLVIFTESIKTLEFLQENLPKALKLSAKQVAVLRGDMTDKDLAETVDNFNQGNSDVRLLLCSDVASEGINLHHLSHRMVHFDIPWSLMVFQQRNGRIDRYGQTQQPLIRYLLTDSDNAKIKGDNRILEVLIEKDSQAGKNIGDPSEFNQEEGEARTAALMESDQQKSQEEYSNTDWASLFDEQFSLSDDLMAAFTPSTETSLEALMGEKPRLFENDLAYAKSALYWLEQEKHLKLQLEIEDKTNTLRLTAPSDLKQRRRFLPREVWPENDRFVLTSDVYRINQELKRCREEDSPWPEIHYLWPLHPVMQWLEDRVLNAFGRHAAPVVRLGNLASNQHWFIMQGGYPNRRGQMHLQIWLAVLVENNQVKHSCSLEEFLKQYPLNQLVNSGEQGDTQPLQALLPKVVAHTQQQFDKQRKQHEEHANKKLNEQMAAMDNLKAQHIQQLELDLNNLSGQRLENAREEKSHEINRKFDNYLHWLEDTQLIDPQPYIQVAAVITHSVN